MNDDCKNCAWHTISIVPCELGKVYAIFRYEDTDTGFAKPIACWSLLRNPRTHEDYTVGLAMFNDCAKLINCEAMDDFLGYYLSENANSHEPTQEEVGLFIKNCDSYA